MTSITFGQGFVGFAYEQIDNSRHTWVNGQYQIRTDQPSYRNVLSNEWDKRSKWEDHRNLRWFWSPDGTTPNRVYCENLTEAIALVRSTWYQEPVPPFKHAPEYNGYIIVWGDLDSGIGEITGPFYERQDALDYADRNAGDMHDWSVQAIVGPVING